MNLYIVFVYNNTGFQSCMKVISELSWDTVSTGYFDNYLKNKKKCVAMWYLVETRDSSSIKYSELNLLNNVILVDKNCREGDITDFRREFIIRKFAGI